MAGGSLNFQFNGIIAGSTSGSIPPSGTKTSRSQSRKLQEKEGQLLQVGH